MELEDSIVGHDEPILVTGATGFIGLSVVQSLLDHGHCNVRAFARPSGKVAKLEAVAGNCPHGARVEVIRGNLLSPEDCLKATRDVAVIIHLAAGSGQKSFPDAFLNSVVTTRNLLEASLQHACLRRFVNIGSFAAYSNTRKRRWRLLDESCPVEEHPNRRGDAYAFAKVKQDEIVIEYGQKFRIPFVIVRPGSVFGPGKESITGRVGIDTFGMFLHMGGSNPIPFTYVANCADAITLAAIRQGVDGEVFNVVDDDPPTSRRFLRLYKRNVKSFRSIYVPHAVSYILCWLWEKYAQWSEGQLPPAFNRSRWHAEWKKTRYTNEKLKKRLGWRPKVPMAEALHLYFEACRKKHRGQHA